MPIWCDGAFLSFLQLRLTVRPGCSSSVTGYLSEQYCPGNFGRGPGPICSSSEVDSSAKSVPDFQDSTLFLVGAALVIHRSLGHSSTGDVVELNANRTRGRARDRQTDPIAL